MPEFVEVKIMCEALQKFVGQKIVDIQAIGTGKFSSKHPLSVSMNHLLTTGVKPMITKIAHQGKFLWWETDLRQYISNPLGMTGGWSYQQGNHSQFKLKFDSNDVIYFNDVRHFGNFKEITQKELDKKLLKLGTPLSDLDDQSYLKIIKSPHNICVILMNQNKFSGIGNYIKNEALYRAGISPWRSGRNLNIVEAKNLINEVKNIVTESYTAGGCSVRDYFHIDGTIGKYQAELKVYGRKNDPNGELIIKEQTPDKRSTYWVKGKQV
jgi:formamidopyrimidine-DNA glycosylase